MLSNNNEQKPSRPGFENIDSLATSIEGLRHNAQHLAIAFPYNYYAEFVFNARRGNYQNTIDALAHLRGQNLWGSFNILYSIAQAQNKALDSNLGIVTPLVNAWKDAVRYLKTERVLEPNLNMCSEIFSRESMSEVSEIYSAFADTDPQQIDVLYERGIDKIQAIEMRHATFSSVRLPAIAGFSYENMPS